jgi:DNA/RNA endonuclease YhcR with UshA esterase domain
MKICYVGFIVVVIASSLSWATRPTGIPVFMVSPPTTTPAMLNPADPPLSLSTSAVSSPTADKLNSPPTISVPSSKPLPPAPITPRSQVGIQWDAASKHIGEIVVICGPAVTTSYALNSKGKPTFLNVGKGYPDPQRLTVVIWEENRSKFSIPPDTLYEGKNICVEGLITLYKGVPEIEVSSPSQITIK